jgi:Putative restriction endonuclease
LSMSSGLRKRGDRDEGACTSATAVGLMAAALDKAFGRGFHVREEKPIALDERSEPEPDVVVVAGRLRDYIAAHPSHPVLVVEVTDSSLALDRLRRDGRYARAGIADYWIVDLIDEVLEVYRDPVAGPAKLGVWKYDSVRLLRRNATVTPLAAPGRGSASKRCCRSSATGHWCPRGQSITSSARASRAGGIVRPSAAAALRLITSSNFEGCSTGKSAGLAPLRILST